MMTKQELDAARERGDFDTVHCANCGRWMFRCEAVTDEGEYKSEEEGRIFNYCSEDCLQAH